MRFFLLIGVLLFSCANFIAQDTLLNVKPNKNVDYKKSTTNSNSFTIVPFFDAHQMDFKSQLDTISTYNFQNRGLKNTEINLGNVGSTTYNLVFDINDVIFNDYTRLAFQQSPKLGYIISNKPITYAEYQTGTNQEQLFNVFHTQTLKNRTNFMVGLDKIKSKGFYQNQATNNTHVFTHIAGVTKNIKYRYIAHFDRNQLISQLNGGIVNDSDFTNNELDFNDKALLQVNLSQAKQSITQNTLSFSQNYAVHQVISDSVYGTSTRWLITHQIQLNTQSRIVYDTLLNTAFYDNFNLNDTVTHDTINYSQALTNLGLNYMKNWHKNSYFNSVYGHSKLVGSYNQIHQMASDTSVMDIEWRNVFKMYLNDYFVSAEMNYLINDAYDKNDYSLRATARWFKSENWNVGFDFQMRRDRPQIDVLNYLGNNAAWDNVFNKTNILNALLWTSFSKKNFNVRVFSNYTDIKNPIFFNLFRQPQQIEGVSQVIQTGFNAQLKLKKWNFENQTVYQYTGGFQIIKIPQLHSNLLAEYTFGAFKNKMDVTVGTSIRYYSKFEAPNYDPVTNQFYLTASYEVGNYPFVDVFLKARIQRFKILIQSTHVNQGLLGSNYFYFPHYPANDRMFKVALSWLFLN